MDPDHRPSAGTLGDLGGGDLEAASPGARLPVAKKPTCSPARISGLRALIKNNARRKKSRLFFYEATLFLFICKNSPMGSFPWDPGQPELRATRDILARWDVCLLGGAHDSRRRLPSVRGLRRRLSVMSKPQKLNVQLTSPLILDSH